MIHMPKKKTGKHLQFYLDCVKDNYRMPSFGLCSCAKEGHIDISVLELFKPTDVSEYAYWASGSRNNCYFKFTSLRQNIVLLMACLNNEL